MPLAGMSLVLVGWVIGGRAAAELADNTAAISSELIEGLRPSDQTIAATITGPGDAWIPMVSADRPWIPKFYSIRNVDTTVL